MQGSDKPMFPAVCSNCGKDTTVPFQPTSGRPVLCRDCFGASRGDIFRHVLGEGMGVALFGLLIGAPATYFAAHRFVNHKDLGMEPLDPAMLTWSIAALVLCAVLAVLAPALRAASADPVKAPRQG